MAWGSIGFGDEAFFDFDGNGKLDTFETALMLDEQDREIEEMFGHRCDSEDSFDDDLNDETDSDDYDI